MLIVSPGGCGEHKEGEFYDTIGYGRNDECKVRFFAGDFGGVSNAKNGWMKHGLFFYHILDSFSKLCTPTYLFVPVCNLTEDGNGECRIK